MPDLPDVPEAAEEAGWAAIRTECFAVRRAPWGDDYWTHLLDANSVHKATRLVLEAALPVLIEQGWTPPQPDEHVIEVTHDGWSIQHPLRCRPDLLGCAVQRSVVGHVDEYGVVMVDAPGRYSVVVGEDGDPTFSGWTPPGEDAQP